MEHGKDNIICYILAVMSGESLRRYRREAGWTQKRLAARLGLTQEYVSLMERGHRAVPDHVLTELVIGLVLMILLSALACIFPATMGPQADPLTTPEEIKPEWFFYVSFRWLKLVSLTRAVISNSSADRPSARSAIPSPACQPPMA